MNRKITLSLISMTVIIIVLVCSTGFLYIQNQTLNEQAKIDDYSNEDYYYDILYAIEHENSGSRFSPTIDMYVALMIAFNYSGWPISTIEELNRIKVDVKLAYGYINETTNTTVILNTITSPQTSYAHVVEDGITYRFMWQIIVYNASSILMPLTHDGYSVVDAETGDILPIPAS